MNNKVLKTVEYNKILKQLENLASSDMAKEQIKALTPLNQLDEIIKLQKQTSFTRKLIDHYGSPEFDGLKNISEIVLRLDKNGTLTQIEILRVLGVMECTSHIKQYYAQCNDSDEKYANLFNNLVTLVDTQKEIRRCILNEEEISDDASIELRNIRRQIKVLNSRVKEKLNEMISSQTYRAMLQEPVITIKQNRYCLPVKLEYKSQIKGVVHEQSSSGQTLFIEPSAILDIDNKIKEYESKEREEIEKILFRLSWLINEDLDTLKNNYNLLVMLDVLFAKAKLSKSMDAIEPKFNTEGYVNLKLARHPLIEKDKVVPINISFGKEYKSVIITGPNTGGKTITLKTVGLLALLAQTGLHIPAFDGSEVAVFDEIFGDIGDEQSVEQSLSTFSAHMKNIIHIINNADGNSLILLDELGAGTDPIEGAALAISILKKLKEKHANIIATTHYSELKHYAMQEESVINASCEFDINTLKPTYKLLMGIPGKSNAFEISKKLGLSDDVIDDAHNYLTTEHTNFEDAILAANKEKELAEEETKKAIMYREFIEKQKHEYDEKIQSLKEEKEKILNKSREEALKILENAKEEAKNVITNLKNEAKQINETFNSKVIQSMKNTLDDKSKELEDSIKKEKEESYRVNPERVSVKKGMEVYLSNLDKVGTIVELPDAQDAVLVLVGIMKIKVSMKYVFRHGNSKSKKKIVTSTNKLKRNKLDSMKFEINVIGLYPSEALDKVDKFIDDAILMNAETIRIVHGKGQGVLKKEIHKLLDSNPNVDSYRLGEFGEGDSGVTIVKIK